MIVIVVIVVVQKRERLYMWTTWLSREAPTGGKGVAEPLQMKQSRGVRGDVHARSLRKCGGEGNCTTRTGLE